MKLLQELTLQLLAFRVLGLLLIASVHGAALGFMAGFLGDRGPGLDGRATVNPLPHLDPWGSLCWLATGFGWVRPIDLHVDSIGAGRAANVLVGATALGVTVLAAWAIEALKPLSVVLSPWEGTPPSVVFGAIARLCLAFSFFNMLPIQPLTGGMFLRAALPGLAGSLRRYGPLPALAVAIALWAFSSY